MKILNVTLDGRIAGPQLQVLELSKILNKKFKIESIVIFPDDNSEKLKKMLISNNVKFKSVKLHRLSKNLFSILKWFLTFFKEILDLKRIIDYENPDLVHCYGSWQWKGILAGKISGKKLIWHLNDTRINFIIKSVFNFLKRFPNGFVIEGSRVGKYYFKNYKINKPFAEINAPVDTKKFNPVNIRKSNYLSGDTKIVSVGNVNPYKGIEYLIEAASILKRRKLTPSFYVIGGLFDSQARYISGLQKKILQYNLINFKFFGSSGMIPNILKEADLYVCSSVSEASPISVWEAMSMGKAIVSTDVGATSDFIKDEENGFIVPVYDAIGLADKIEILLKNSELCEKFGKISREIAMNELDISVCAEKLIRFYTNLLNEKR